MVKSPPVKRHQSDSSDLLDSLQHEQHQRRGIVHYNRLRKAGNVVVVISLVCFVATIALIGLSQAGFIHPASALYAFSGVIGGLILLAILTCCQKRVCKIYDVNYERCREQYEPLPPPDEKEKKKEES